MRLRDYIINGMGISSESELDEVIQSLMNPSDDRDEMGEVFMETLGYNPVTHFDYSDTSRMLRELIKSIPEEYADIKADIEYDRDEILDIVVNTKDSAVEDHLACLLAKVIGERYGIVRNDLYDPSEENVENPKWESTSDVTDWEDILLSTFTREITDIEIPENPSSDDCVEDDDDEIDDFDDDEDID